jgi:hypothetical protein
MKIPRKSGEWIIIIKDIPVQEKYKPLPLSIYYAFPTKFFWGDDFSYHPVTMAYMREAFKGNNDDIIRLIADKYYRGKIDREELTEKQYDLLEESYPTWQMKIRTRNGDVCIQPHEYNIIEDLSIYLEAVKDGGAFIRYLNEEETIKKGKIADQIFYLRSRGIGFADAIMMITGNIKTQNLFYIEFHEEYRKIFFR